MGYGGICVMIGMILDWFLLLMTDMKLGRLVGGLSLVMLVIPLCILGVVGSFCWRTIG